MVSAVERSAAAVILSGGLSPESRNLPLPADLSAAARGDKRAFGTYQRLVKEKRNGKDSECVFISMSGFPFRFHVMRDVGLCLAWRGRGSRRIGTADPSSRFAPSG